MISYAKDIYPLFTDKDVRGMSKFFDLRSFRDVKARSEQISNRIRGIWRLGHTAAAAERRLSLVAREDRSI
ncbi:hypothetical protein CWO90_35095 [Bradyrhizobium sp. Leo121]|nr:hypothetical protein CWO90_35095 [Bradyrhizobium sp. Leo121]